MKSKKLKIVHIAQSNGGVEEYIYLLLSNLSNKYENILIVSEQYKRSIDRFKALVNKIYIVPMIRDINIRSDLNAIKEVRKILKKEKADIIYLHSSKAGAIGRIALWFNRKAKVIYNAHGWYFNAQISEKKKKVFVWIEKILALRANKIINISKSEYDSAIHYKIAKPDKMVILENGIDFSRFEDNEKHRYETRKKFNIHEDEKIIGVVGRITQQKDPMTTMRAFNLVHKKDKNTKLMFIGDGDLKNEVLEYAKQNNIEEDILITGWVRDVENYIPALDIAILPSKWEGFGLAIIEYMACNKPIIATNIGGIADIIKNNENGFLVEVEDYRLIAKKINELLSEKKEVERIVKNNCKYKIKYDIKNLVKEHERIFVDE